MPKAEIKNPLVPPPVTRPAPVTEAPKGNSWEFKITGQGTSGWMSWVKEDGKWVPLRASNTSFISAVSAIEPEVMRLAFPHTVTAKKAI